MEARKKSETLNVNTRIAELVNHFTAGNQRQFALLTGLKPPTLHAMMPKEKGKVVEPSAASLEQIAKALEGLNTHWLLTGEGAMLHLPGKNEDLELAYAELQEKEQMIDFLMAELTKARNRARVPDPLRAAVASLGKFNPLYEAQILHPDAYMLRILGAGMGAVGRAA